MNRSLIRKWSQAALLITVAALPSLVFSQYNVVAGRIAVSSDGNVHDTDDFGATALALSLIDAVGANSKLVHYDYSNHLGYSGHSPDYTYKASYTGKSFAQREAEMVTSALGGADRFGMNKSVFFDDQKNLSGAINNMANEINKSSASNPLFIIGAGPMEVIWRGVNASQSAKRQYVTVVSHSSWNDGHADTDLLKHKWSDVINLGVKSYKIKDQNTGLQKPYSDYAFLKNSTNLNWKWLYSRLEAAKTTNADPSDAGMTYWLLTGGPNGGDQDGTPSKVNTMLSKKGSTTPPPSPSTQSPYKGTPFAIPGTIQAEDFDNGGQGVAFNDGDASNSGGAYRSTGVDLQSTSEGGYNVGWTKSGEWLEYTVNVTSAGTHNLAARVASTFSSGAFRVEFGGSDKTGSISVSNTGGWQKWVTLNKSVSLSSGQQVMRVYITGGDFNLNYITITKPMSKEAVATSLLLSPSLQGEREFMLPAGMQGVVIYDLIGKMVWTHRAKTPGVSFNLPETVKNHSGVLRLKYLN